MLAPPWDFPWMRYVKGMSSLTVSQYYFTVGLRSTKVISSSASPDNIRDNIVTVCVSGLVLDPFNGVIMNLFSFPYPFVAALRGNVGGSNSVAITWLLIRDVLVPPFLKFWYFNCLLVCHLCSVYPGSIFYPQWEAILAIRITVVLSWWLCLSYHCFIE